MGRPVGCLRVLAVVSNAAKNMGVQVSFWVTVFIAFDIFPEVGLLDHVCACIEGGSVCS